jgi:hypothetical protein
LVTAFITDCLNYRRKTVGNPTENGWGTVSIRVNGNKGRKRGGRNLRILSFFSSFFRASFVEKTSGEGVFFRVASSWIAGTPQYRVTGSWFAGTA